MNRRRLFSWLLIGLCFSFTIPPIAKSLPIVREKECYRSVFPRKAFLAKLDAPIPQWMQEQIGADLRIFEKGITLEAIEKTYETISKGTNVFFYRYRIVDNELYSYKSFSGTDTPFEKALKTLLLYAKLPDIDFIFCPMDGLPEAYMPSDFYITKNFEDQAPIFAKAKISSAPYVVLVPDQFSLSETWFYEAREICALNQKISWDEKKEIAFWRGGLTDIGAPNEIFVPQFRDCPRYKISKLSFLSPKFVDAGLSWSNCSELDSLLQQEKVKKGGASKEEHLLCKYLPVLDGHMCTYPGYQWRLLSNSVCFKQESDQSQWFYSALKPYVHYIPVKNDMSDLLDQIEWAKSNDLLVRQIVQNAQGFALNHLMFEDHYYYLFLALKEYASRQKMGEGVLEETTGRDKNWKCIQYRKRQQLAKSWNRFRKNIFL